MSAATFVRTRLKGSNSAHYTMPWDFSLLEQLPIGHTEDEATEQSVLSEQLPVGHTEDVTTEQST